MTETLALPLPSALSLPLTQFVPVPRPIVECAATNAVLDELSDLELERVVGGLARVWAGAEASAPAVPAIQVMPLRALHDESAQRISA